MSLRKLEVQAGSPCVAVVVAAFHAEATIGRAIHSALREREVAEVVVVDDGSTDRTADAAAAADDRTGRLRILQQANAGPSAARNKAIDRSSAPAWRVLDAADTFAPRRLEHLLSVGGRNWDILADPADFQRSGRTFQRLEPDGGSPQTITLERSCAGISQGGSRPAASWDISSPSSVDRSSSGARWRSIPLTASRRTTGSILRPWRPAPASPG